MKPPPGYEPGVFFISSAGPAYAFIYGLPPVVFCEGESGSHSSGFRSPSMVGISSDTVGWACTAR